MTIDIVSDDRELLLLQPEWDALWSSVESPCYSQSFNYILACWQEMFKSHSTLLRCIVIRQLGNVVLIWPLIVTKKAFVRLLQPLCAGAAEFSQPLVEEGPEAVEMCALAWSAARSRIKADILSMSNVKEGSCLDAVLSREAAFSIEKDIAYLQQGGERWKDWETYYKAVSAGHSLKPERKRRLLGEHGEIRFETMERSSEVPATIDWCLRQKREWAERVDKRGAWLYSEEFRDLLVTLYASESSAQCYIIFLLTLDGSPIAARIAAYNKVKLEGILSCFDARWAKYSPGSLLDAHVAQWLVERSMEHEFGVGSEEYKKLWSYNHATPVAGYKFAGSLLGRLALEAWQWRRARRERLKALKSARDKTVPAVNREVVVTRE